MNTRLGAVVCAAVLAAGCHDPITEVVLVMTSDLIVPNDVNFSAVAAVPGNDPPLPMLGFQSSFMTGFPLTTGIQADHTDVFSATIQLSRIDQATFMMVPVVTRNVTGVRFVHDEIRMVVVHMPAACACHGTNCPLPETNPECDDLVSPEAVPLDPQIAPPSSANMGGAGVVFEAAVGAKVDLAQAAGPRPAADGAVRP